MLGKLQSMKAEADIYMSLPTLSKLYPHGESS